MWIENEIKTVLNQFYIQFTLQLLISEFIFFFQKEKKNVSKIRYYSSVVVLFFSTWIWAVFINSFIPWSSMWNMIIYPGFAALTYFWIRFNYEMLCVEALIVVCSGYATEHIAYCATRIFLYWLQKVSAVEITATAMYNTNSVWFILGVHVLPYIVVSVLIYYLVVRKNRDKLEFWQSDYKLLALFFVLMVSAILLSWCYSKEEYWNTLVGMFVCPMYGIISCLLVLIMVYYVLWTRKMQLEQESMEQLIHISESQQKSTKEAIDIINIKCHDLKHQIQALGRMSEEKEREAYIKEIKDAVFIYDAVYHTGNSSLDYVLREKTLISGEYNIKFSIMADGSLLDFMHSADIYALISNAIDNAFESVIKEPEEKRIVSLQIKKQGKMILIHLENWCSSQPEFVDGLPITGKSDKNYHGFGVRSIRYITEKYNGEVMMRVQNNIFYLDIMFPENIL